MFGTMFQDERAVSCYRNGHILLRRKDPDAAAKTWQQLLMI